METPISMLSSPASDQVHSSHCLRRLEKRASNLRWIKNYEWFTTLEGISIFINVLEKLPTLDIASFVHILFLALSGVMFCQETDANGNLFCDIVHINVYMTVYSWQFCPNLRIQLFSACLLLKCRVTFPCWFIGNPQKICQIQSWNEGKVDLCKTL